MSLVERDRTGSGYTAVSGFVSSREFRSRRSVGRKMDELNETTRIPFTVDPAEPEVASETLIIYGEDFEPSDVTRVLGLQPNRTWRKGERKSFVRADGTQLAFDSLYEWNGWKMWLDESTRARQLCEQLQHWHDLLMPRAAQMRKLRDQG